MEEKRAPRYKTMFPCSFSFAGRSANGFLENISLDGMAIESETIPFVGSKIVVMFFDHFGKKIRFRGHVVHDSWVQANENLRGFGVQISLIDAGRQEFENMLAILASREKRRGG